MASITTQPFLCITAMVAICVSLTGCETISHSTSTAVSGARVAEVRGSVRITDASKRWRTLRAGEAVANGNLIQTALGSAADLVVGGAGTAHCRILIQVDSVLAVESLPNATANELYLELRSGWLTLSSTGGNQSPRCEISFPNGVAGAHGATFSLTADGRLKVMAGSVVFKSLDNQPARTITAGTQFNAKTGAVEEFAVAEPPEKPASKPAPAPAKSYGDNPFPWIQRPK